MKVQLANSWVTILPGLTGLEEDGLNFWQRSLWLSLKTSFEHWDSAPRNETRKLPLDLCKGHFPPHH